MKEDSLIVGAVERMPILGQIKLFHTWNQSTVATAECQDASGRVRGAIVIGFSNVNRPDGCATYSSIEEARALVKLIEAVITDAERIEQGLSPLAQPGNPRLDN